MTDVVARAAEAIGRNDLSSAESLSKQALEADPLDLAAHLILGATYARTRRYELAISELRTVLNTDPDSFDALKWISECLRRLGRVEEAFGYAQRAADINPNSECLFGRAMCLIGLGRYGEAEKDLRAVLASETVPSALHFLGLCLTRLERAQEAIPLFEQAIRMEPTVSNHWVAIGQAHFGMHNYAKAIEYGQRALQIRPNDVSANLLLAQALSLEGQTPEAETFLRNALEADPNSAEANGLFGMWLHQMGRFDEAEKFVDRALEVDPGQAKPLYFKVQGRTMSHDDRPLIERMESRVQSETVDVDERIALNYGLGKAYLDLGELPLAFRHFEEANTLSYRVQKQLGAHDGSSLKLFADKAIQVFSKNGFDRWQEMANPSNRPIFVLGMIRSGTTLMEQLISAHPEVVGAGELRFWSENALALLDETAIDIDVSKIPPTARNYLETLAKRSETSRFVTDKMPNNFWMLGFIHACLPNAKIIDMVRDPVDIAFSVWMTYIGKPPPFGNDKRDIVEACRQHSRLRKHWSEVLPAEVYRQVHYEDLTADPERIMRQVLEFCDLSWCDACVRPEDNMRFVSTPSLYRVRRPIDRQSVSKRERFAAYLGEFAELIESQ
jgi:tetratricopeptide (TPR) repeat protein